MRVLWHSVAPWAASGYGNQTKEFTPRIRDQGHDVAISAYWGAAGSILAWDGMDVYPQDEEYGARLMPAWARMHNADLVITLMDVWPLKTERLRTIRNMASWLPVDHDPVPAKTLEFFEETQARPIAMSRFGERMCRDAGMDPLYVPHGIDTRTLAPAREVRNATREKMGVPKNAFVIGMVAANKGRTPSRKSFPEVFQAFAEFQRSHEDAHLYLHTDPTTQFQGVPLGRLIQRCEIPQESVSFTSAINTELGIPPAEMAKMYSAFDVLANPAYGEGFGIPIVEAQSCGCPVVVTDFSAMSELCGAGWLVEADPWYDSQHGAFFGRPKVTGPGSIVEGFERAYKHRHDKELRMRAREFALGYDSDVVAEVYWRPALEALTPAHLTGKQAPALVLPDGVR